MVILLRKGYAMTMGERIRKRRQALRLSQQDLSEMTGIRRATLSDLESDKQTGMTVDTAKRLARALGVSIDYLAGTWEEDEQYTPAAVALVGASVHGGSRSSLKSIQV